MRPSSMLTFFYFFAHFLYTLSPEKLKNTKFIYGPVLEKVRTIFINKMVKKYLVLHIWPRNEKFDFFFDISKKTKIYSINNKIKK